MPPPDNPPWGLHWRSNTFFILTTVAVGLFTDLFLYGLVVPVLPYMLRRRIKVPDGQIQTSVAALLAVFAGASVLSSVPAGWIADRTGSRRTPFLGGLAALLAATIMFALGRDMAVLYISRILQGISAAIVWTTGLAMVLDTVGPQNLGKVVGSIFSFISIGELMSPVLGGVLYEKTGYTGVFVLGASLLAVDFIMRLLVVEKKFAAKYIDNPVETEQNESPSSSNLRADVEAADTDGDGLNQETSEAAPLLPKKGEEEDDDDEDNNEFYIIPSEPQNRLIRALPILICFHSPRLCAGLFLSLVQAALLAVFDATIPIEAQRLFGFSPLQAGLLFIPLDVPFLLLGPVGGWAVDRYGTKRVAVFGFTWLVPALILLRLPSSSSSTLSSQQNIILYCALLAIAGVGLAAIGSPSLVEASEVMRRYERANPDFFGPNGPYAQLYGFSSLFFNLGLTVGPVVAGALNDNIGYGNMNLVFAMLSGVTAVLSFFIVGGAPRLLSRRARRRIG